MKVHNCVIRYIFFFSLYIVAMSCNTKTGNTNLNEYQEDFLQIAAFVRRTHPGFSEYPLRVMTFDEYDDLTKKTFTELAEAETEEEWMIELSWFLEKLKDAHTALRWKPSRFAPIGVWWFGDELFVVSSTDDSTADLIHKRIVKIGGLDPLSLEKKINQFVSSDADHERYKRLTNGDLMLSRAYLDHFGLLDVDGRIEISYADQDSIKRIVLPCTFPDPNTQVRIRNKFRNSITAVREGNHYLVLEKDAVLYMQLNNLPARIDKSFFEEAFIAARKEGANTLLLDLRNNGGGNSQWCNEFLSYIVDRERDIYLYEGWASAFPKPNKKLTDGLTRIRPVSDALLFQGDVFLLVGPKTFSSATFFAVAVKDNNLGLLFGEPLGNASIRFGYMADPITLKNSGMKFSTTHHVWGRALPGAITSNHSILPDHFVEPSLSDLIEGRDAVFEKAIEWTRR